MCPYLSLSCRNSHTAIWSNICTLWSWRPFSCIPTLVSTLSNFCCCCTLNAGCCLAMCRRGHFLCILCKTYILLDFSSFLCFSPTPYFCAYGICGMCFYLFAGWGGGGGDIDVDEEGKRQMCRLSFSFCLRRPLHGTKPSLSVVVAAFALSLLISN